MERNGHEVHIDDLTLNRFADGILPERSAAAVRLHLRSCAACRRDVQFIRALSAAIRSVPTPKPPDALIEELFPEKPRTAAVIPLTAPQRAVVSLPRGRATSVGAILLAVIGTVAVLTAGPDRVLAGSSTLNLEWEEPGALALQYETISPLAKEPALRARMRYWVPDSLRFAQTEPGYGVVELSREESGVFLGVAHLPPGTVYAVAAVEDLDGNYIDSDFGRFWEYLETDGRGRPTLAARLYQVLATADLKPSRVVEVTEQALSQYPERPELWATLLLYGQGDAPEGRDSKETYLGPHNERFERLDAAARQQDPGPGGMHALSLYARLLGREDLEAYWQSELISEHPRHEYASQARLEEILLSSMSLLEKMVALDRSWRLAPVPSVTQVGLQLSYEVADPALTRVWLERYAADRALRDSRLDVQVAERMIEIPTLRAIAEEWVLQQLTGHPAWLGTDRPLNGSRSNFEVETAENLARLHLLLGRLRLARGDRAAAFDSFEDAAELSWDPQLLVELARFHARAGSLTRASQLLALAQTDPITPLEPYLSESEEWVTVPAAARLAAARSLWREYIASSLLNEPVDGSARLQIAPGEEKTLREVTDGEVGLIIQSLRPSYVSAESLGLLRANTASLEAAGVRVLSIAVHPDPPSASHTDSPDHLGSSRPVLHDRRSEIWEALGAWREVQYFVVGPTSTLRYRGEDLAAAVRIALTLGDNSLAPLR